MIRLSKRLEALSRLCEAGGCAADVGCDHGYLSIRLVQEARFERMLAMDLREGPLAAARVHVAEAGLSERIECRLSDGLRTMQAGEAEAMICAGMGGPLMQRILEQDIDKVRTMKQLVLQPQSDIKEFRRWLRENGFVSAAEDIVTEDGKYYPMMRVIPGGTDPAGTFIDRPAGTEEVSEEITDELADAFGARLLAERHPVLRDYLKQRDGFVTEALEQLGRAQEQGSDERREQRIDELEQERQLIQGAMAFYTT